MRVGCPAFVGFSTCRAAAAAAAPLLLLNGNIYTGADAQPRAQAIVIVEGRITFVGATADALRRAPAAARRVDLHGVTVLPGLTMRTRICST